MKVRVACFSFDSVVKLDKLLMALAAIFSLNLVFTWDWIQGWASASTAVNRSLTFLVISLVTRSFASALMDSQT